VPSCANDYLLNQVIRSAAGFNRSDVVVGTDCGAVDNMVHANHYASSDLDAAAKTLNGGTDMELGDQTWSSIANGGKGKLKEAVLAKTVNVSRIDESVARIMHLRMITGQFDPIKNQPYTTLGDESINSTAGWQLNLEAALQSFVLLKNNGYGTNSILHVSELPESVERSHFATTVKAKTKSKLGLWG
jgi:beta-glucosidase-like glycosyl hydrolase